MKRLFLRSVEENLPLEMIYLSSSNQITQRRIIVREINEFTIRAYCHLRKQTRLFKIENILSLMPLTNYRRNLG
ncbi:hypothetical protein SM124_01395 [Bacillus sp. 31A1R]|uniref:WYL domain-containing protein n=1 Tax=Robertmurraya mangrovi TaxID=3098077 RepID=A0ABU5ITB1_9BACI|nr:hypothetical protein [Bacillus sp. 31A1R]MDZ5470393.1 hypothetical protein [Bacillus sp. 31A1R]